MSILALVHINPVARESETNNPGNIAVEVHWPDDVNSDVDLWVKAPASFPVGYSRKNGRVFNLLRDDLGFINDPTEENYEFAFSRGAPNGEYIVNLHLFRSSIPVEVRVLVSIKRGGGRADPIFSGVVDLLYENHEVTAIRFDLNNGNVSNLHSTPILLKTKN